MRFKLAISLACVFSACALSACSPAEKAKSDAPRIAVSDLKPGQFKLADFPVDPDKQSLLLLRQSDGKLQAWHLGKKDGQAMLPHDHWWKNDGLPCKEVKVDFAADRIYCADAGLAAERQQYFSWRLNGAPLRQGGLPLQAAGGAEAAGDFVFIK